MATLDAWLSGRRARRLTARRARPTVGSSLPDAAPPVVECNSNNVTLAPASAVDDAHDRRRTTTSATASRSRRSATGIDHVLGVTPNIDNHTVVHHVLLFQADANDTTVTTTPAPCNAGGSLTWRIVYGWAPGGGPMQTPPNVGFPYDSTTQWIVQVHYSNQNALSGETDTSGFSFCSTDQPVQYDADVVAFGSMNFKIPANASLDISCKYTIPSLLSGIHTFAGFPHMHVLGTSIQTEQTFASGAGIVGMAENTPWNFNNQLQFPIDATLNQGDVVTTRCAWQNSTGFPVSFGPNTENEMCYSFTAYYPKVTSATWFVGAPCLEHFHT